MTWKTTKRDLILDCSPWFRVYQEEILLDDAETTVTDFYQVEGADVAAVFPLTEDGQVVMLRQYRHGVGERVLGFPSGYVDEGESALETAQRELLEETGFTAKDWQLLAVRPLDGNRGYHTIHLYLARGARRTTDPVAVDLSPQDVEVRPLEIARALWLSGSLAEVTSMALAGLAFATLIDKP